MQPSIPIAGMKTLLFFRIKPADGLENTWEAGVISWPSAMTLWTGCTPTPFSRMGALRFSST